MYKNKQKCSRLNSMKGCSIPLAEDVLQSIQQCRGFDPRQHTHALYRLKNALAQYGNVSLALSMCRAPKNNVGACVSLTLIIPPEAMYTLHDNDDDNDDDGDANDAVTGYSARFRCGVGEVQLNEVGLGSSNRDTLYIAQQRGRRVKYMTRCIAGTYTPNDEHMFMLLMAHLPDYLPEPMARHVRDYALSDKPESILANALLNHCNCFCEAPLHDDYDDNDGIMLLEPDAVSTMYANDQSVKRVCTTDVRHLTKQL